MWKFTDAEIAFYKFYTILFVYDNYTKYFNNVFSCNSRSWSCII